MIRKGHSANLTRVKWFNNPDNEQEINDWLSSRSDLVSVINIDPIMVGDNLLISVWYVVKSPEKEVKKEVVDLFKEEDPMQKICKRIISKLKKSDFTTRRDISRFFNKSVKMIEVYAAIDHLESKGILKRFEIKPPNGGRPTAKFSLIGPAK